MNVEVGANLSEYNPPPLVPIDSWDLGRVDGEVLGRGKAVELLEFP